MSIIDRIKNIFSISNNKDYNNDLTLINKKDLIEYKERINRLNDANGYAEKEIKRLKEENDKLKQDISSMTKRINSLKNTIVRLQSDIDNTNKPITSTAGEFTYWTKKEYLPKQEPIRSSKPKRNRNNRKRYYKKSSDKKEEKHANEVTLIDNKYIPKPGSGDKVEFKNGEPVRRKRKKVIE